MRGKRVAILGLGRSGLAIGRAAARLGAHPTVLDEKPESALPKPELASEALELGIELTLGWSGPLADLPDRPDFLVVNPAVPKAHRLLREAQESGIEILSEVEFGYRISKAPIVAITGTNGKSTTTVMTYLCLKACGVDAVLCGNIFGSGYPEETLTDAALESTPDQVLVAEISSFQLEWVSEFHPVAATVTNLTPDHLDRYGSFEEYAATKLRIFENLGPQDTAVLTGDPLVQAPPGPKVLRVGVDARVEDDRLVILDRSISLRELPFSEPHNLRNACTAALLAHGALAGSAGFPTGGQPPEDGLRSFHGLAHRMERLGKREGVEVINNSMCTNPDAVVKSAEAIPQTAHLLIGGVNKKLDFEPLRNYLARSPSKAYLFGTDASKLNEMLGAGYPVFSTLEEAFDAATRAAKDGEVIMLAPGCASTDQFRDFRDRGEAFKAIAKEWLRS